MRNKRVVLMAHNFSFRCLTKQIDDRYLINFEKWKRMANSSRLGSRVYLEAERIYISKEFKADREEWARRERREKFYDH